MYVDCCYETNSTENRCKQQAVGLKKPCWPRSGTGVIRALQPNRHSKLRILMIT